MTMRSQSIYHNGLCRALVLLSVLTAVGLWLGGGQYAEAGTYTYSTQQRTVNAGILLVKSTGINPNNGVAFTNAAGKPIGPDNPNPYIFQILQQRTDIKPFGWNIVNPLAQKTVTGDIQDRWNARYQAITGNTPPNAGIYQLGQKLTANMAAYWEVSLDQATVSDLSHYDILFISLRGLNLGNNYVTAFSAADSEKLRRFVDGGGQLWVEDEGGTQIADATITTAYPAPTVNPVDAQPFFSIQFHNSGTNGFAQLPISGAVPVRHPTLSSPYFLSNDELNSLGDKTIANYFISLGGNGNAGALPAPDLLSTVLYNSADTLPVITAGQLGAGQVIVTDLGVGNAINDYASVNAKFPTNEGPYGGFNIFAAPAEDLKFLANLISWSSAHPNEFKNSHQNSASADSTSASVTATWSYPVSADGGNATGAAVQTGAAIQGNVAYVTDSLGALHAFDLDPVESLSGTQNPDDGFQDYSLGAPYDQVWVKPFVALGAGTSAPTIATDQHYNGGAPFLLVEKADGTVLTFDAATGSALGTLPNSGGATYVAIQPAPAPTYYNGRVYAAEGSGSVYVYDFSPNPDANNVAHPAHVGVVYQINAADPNLILTSPSVGTVTDTGNDNTANDIVCYVSTELNTYALYLGARGEKLSENGNNYTTKVGSLSPASGTQLEGTAASPPRAYTRDITYGYPVAFATGTFAPASPGTFPGPTNPAGEDLYADYNMDATAGLGSLPAMTVQSSPTSGDLFNYSTPAYDKFGNAIYVANCTSLGTSALVCVHDNLATDSVLDLPIGGEIRWRFRMPTTEDGTVVDADSNNYTDAADANGNPRSLTGAQFFGSPVVDSDGLVYAVANVPGGAAVLCFDKDHTDIDGTPNVTGDVSRIAAGSPLPTGSLSIQQPVPAGTTGGNSEFNIAATNLNSNQYSYNQSTGIINFKTFANTGNVITPNLSEPQEITATIAGNSPVAVPLHTNLVWYTIIQNTVATSSPTLVGNYLFFGSSDGTLHKIYAKPQADGIIGADRFVPPTAKTSSGVEATAQNTSFGQIGAVPSSSNGFMVVNGQNGITAFSSQYTLVTDNSRILELDADGNAAWIADSTNSTTLEGGAPRFVDNASTAKRVTTHVDLNHPSSVTQLTSNDYLVADTGNNRCVRFDRSGKATWELTAFNDEPVPPGSGLVKTNKMLAQGEALTLNQPTSVVISKTYFADPGGGQGTVVHYLIADTGNYRVLDVVDIYNAKGQLVGVPHNLIWVSHTQDIQGRQYRYTSADYYYINGQPYVVALVTNTRINHTGLNNGTTEALGPANADSTGGSIVFLLYDPTHTSPLDGHVTASQSTFDAYLDKTGKFDINAALADPNYSNTNPAIPPALLQLKNPRFLKAYTTPNTTAPIRHFLIADDNGAYDLALLNGATVPVAEWGFTQKDYQAVQTPVSTDQVAKSLIFDRSNISFVPGSIQIVGKASVVVGTQTTSANEYLISTSATNGEPNGPQFDGNGNALLPSPFGGEVFQTTLVQVPFSTALETIESHFNPFSLLPYKYSGPTFSRPGNTGPLVQPTFAGRL